VVAADCRRSATEFYDERRGPRADCGRLRARGKVNMIKTGDRSYCIIAEWSDMDALAAARPDMIATLNSFRDTLENLGNDLGVTDPVSGPGMAVAAPACRDMPEVLLYGSNNVHRFNQRLNRFGA
jgi:hypothetical protein